MFSYNPTVNDRSGEILTSASTNAAAIQLQGMQSLSQGIGNAMESLGEGYAKANENKMTSEYLDQMANFYSQTMGPDGKTPLMSGEDLEKFTKASLGAKQGMIVPRQAQYDQMLKNSYAELAFAQALARSNNAAAQRNQVPANQQPVSLGATSAPQGITPSYMAKIPPRPQQQP